MAGDPIHRPDGRAKFRGEDVALEAGRAFAGALDGEQSRGVVVGGFLGDGGEALSDVAVADVLGSGLAADARADLDEPGGGVCDRTGGGVCGAFDEFGEIGCEEDFVAEEEVGFFEGEEGGEEIRGGGGEDEATARAIFEGAEVVPEAWRELVGAGVVDDPEDGGLGWNAGERGVDQEGGGAGDGVVV